MSISLQKDNASTEKDKVISKSFLKIVEREAFVKAKDRRQKDS